MQTTEQLQQENNFLRDKLEQKNAYIVQLEEWIKQQRHKQFGPSSEKLSPDQLSLFNEAEAIEGEVMADTEEGDSP